jgi:hypothetical protein
MIRQANRRHPQNLFLPPATTDDDMSLRNIRRQVAEPSDPKQRIVGGIVLFLLILFIYSFLKLVLGFSSTPQRFELNAPLQTEQYPTAENSNGEPSRGNMNMLVAEAVHPVTSSADNQRLPQKFVFLNLQGKPMQPEVFQTVKPATAEAIYTAAAGEDKWYVQVASFKDEDSAQRLVAKIKGSNISPEVHIIQRKGWYGVRLPPQEDKNVVHQQNRQLKTVLQIKGEVKKIN